MKKSNRNILIVSFISIFIVISLLFYFGVMQTFVRYGGELNADNFDTKSWTISYTSHTSGVTGDAQGKIPLTINHVGGSTNYAQRYNLLCSKINDIAGSGTCLSQGSSEPTSTFASRVSALATEKLGNSFIVFEGTYNEWWTCKSISFRTYGLFDKFSGYIYDPAPEVEGGGGDCPVGELYPTDIKIYFKLGGYTEESGKQEFGFTNVTYYRFEDNGCKEVSIISSLKLSNDYTTLSECKSKIVGTLGYNLVNNKCESVGSNAQYSTLSECQDDIILSSTGYSIENGICKYVTSNPEFNTQSECEQSLVEPKTSSYSLIFWIVLGIVLILVILLIIGLRRKR